MLRKEGEDACWEVVGQAPLQVPVLLSCQYLVRGHPSPHIIPEKHGNIQVWLLPTVLNSVLPGTVCTVPQKMNLSLQQGSCEQPWSKNVPANRQPGLLSPARGRGLGTALTTASRFCTPRSCKVSQNPASQPQFEIASWWAKVMSSLFPK